MVRIRVLAVALTAAIAWGVGSTREGWLRASSPSEGKTTASARPVTTVRDDVLYAELLAHEGTSFAPYADGKNVRVVLAVDEGASDLVRIGIARLGGRVDVLDPQVGFVRALVPLQAWPAVRGLAGITAAEIDGLGDFFWGQRVPTPKVFRDGGRSIDTSATTELSRKAAADQQQTAGVRRTASQEALGLSRLWAQHPTFDGRGVGIAIIEQAASNIPLDHPAFGQALDREGRPVSKFADLLIVGPSSRRVAALETFETRESYAYTRGGIVRVPRAGTFHLGRVDLPSGATSVSWAATAVLWSPTIGEVRFDTNHDLDFANDHPLKDVRTEKGSFLDTGAWGRLFVTLSSDRREVNLHFGRSPHPTMSISVAAASESNGVAGTAPGARLILIDTGDTSIETSTSVWIEALLVAARHPDVDLISMSVHVPIAWPSAGTDVFATLAQRIVTVYQKPIVRSAGNNSLVGRTGQFGEAALEVGAFIPRELAQRHLGLTSTRISVTGYTARGPRIDGAAKPDVVGPVAELSASPCVDRGDLERSRFFFTAPPCYRLSTGTSGAAPAISGLTASLISGLKQHGARPEAEVIYAAVRDSAQPLEGMSVAAQGAGVPQADRAWHLLTQHRRPSTVESRASARMALDRYLPTPAQGVGLFEREGWRIGQSGRRQLTLRRDDGPEIVRYRVRLVGDLDCFRVPDEIVTRRGIDTVVPISITARRLGVLSARLVLQDPSGRTSTRQHQLTVVASDVLAVHASSGMAPGLSYRGRIEPNALRDIPVLVEPGTPLVSVSLTADEDVSMLIQEPAGWNYHRESLNGFSFNKTGRSTFVIPQPAAGTWMFSIFNRSDESDAGAKDPRAYSLQIAAAQFSSVLERSETRDHARLRVAMRGMPNVGLLPLRAETSRSTQTLAADGAPILLPFVVPDGVALTQWQVTTPEDRVGIHAYLFDCTSGYCVRKDTGVPASGSYVAAIDRPSSGKWLLVVSSGPAQHEAVPLLVDFSIARIDAKSSQNTDMRLIPNVPYLHTYDVGCETDTRQSLVLRVVDPRSTESGRQSKEPETGKLVPTLPVMMLPDCLQKSSTASTQQAPR